MRTKVKAVAVAACALAALLLTPAIASAAPPSQLGSAHGMDSQFSIFDRFSVFDPDYISRPGTIDVHLDELQVHKIDYNHFHLPVHVPDVPVTQPSQVGLGD